MAVLIPTRARPRDLGGVAGAAPSGDATSSRCAGLSPSIIFALPALGTTATAQAEGHQGAENEARKTVLAGSFRPSLRACQAPIVRERPKAGPLVEQPAYEDKAPMLPEGPLVKLNL